jgi:putative endonuclease
MSFLYILHSASLDRYYTGSTDALPQDRLLKHLANHKGYTGKAKDWRIVYLEEFTDIHQALNREKQIKSWKSKLMIETLIKNAISN